MKTNGGRRRDEILAEVESVRSDMDSTLSQIERKLTPGELVDQGLEYLRGSGANEFLSNLGTSVKENPVPVALTGICRAWLMTAGRAGNVSLRTEPAGSSLRRKTDQAWSDAREQARRTGKTLSDAAQAAREKLDQAKQSLSGTAQSAREGLSRGADLAQRQLERARGGYEWILREQPLALAAIGVAVGALLAAAAPRTRAEDEWMGEASDRLTERAKEAGREQIERASDALRSAASPQEAPGSQQPQQPGNDSKAEWPK